MFADERKGKIMEIIQIQNRITVCELTDTLSVSEATIRRDLQELEQLGLIKRAHGGAILNLPNNLEPSYTEKEITLLNEKTHIAKLAAGFIKDEDVIILDAGTTTIQMIPFIANKNITVITNSISIAYALTSYDNINLIVAGGQNRSITKALVGDFSNNIFKQLHANKVFMGTNGFEFGFGFSTPNIEEAKTKNCMIEASDEIFIVADYSKFNKSSMVKFSDITEIDYLITDPNIPKNIINKFKKEGVKVIL